MSLRQQDDLRCFQCGRVGVRGFKHVPEREVDTPWGKMKVGGWDECANANACRSRWPKARDVEYL